MYCCISRTFGEGAKVARRYFPIATDAYFPGRARKLMRKNRRRIDDSIRIVENVLIGPYRRDDPRCPAPIKMIYSEFDGSRIMGGVAIAQFIGYGAYAARVALTP